MQESIKNKRLFSITYNTILTFLILAVASLPFFVNFKYNNHSKNWLNHDYGKNLLSSTELYSIFMTEGGDNQVFSSLYFTYAEKLRQDIFPYDQKGNIFKRIYGDLRYVTYETLQKREQSVNQGLFNGEEPFYTDIRSSRDPYLVPYALGKPSVYLTWQLPNPDTLGDFYYKNYGQMYKVQEIPYAIVDRLAVLESASINTLKDYIQKLLANKDRNYIDTQWNNWVRKLEYEGLIRQRGSQLVFLKNYPKPFINDPKESFIRRWDQIPNLKYYDYLSREIVLSFAYEQMNFLADEIQNDLLYLDIENDPNIREKIETSMNQKWEEIIDYIDTIEEVGEDSAATLHNVGIFLLNVPQNFPFVQENYKDRANRLWEKVLKTAPYAWSTYNILMWNYLKDSFNTPENAEGNFVKFDKIFSQMANNMTHFISMKQDITKAQPYQQVQQLVQTREAFEQLSGTTLLNERTRFSETLANNPSALNLTEVQIYFNKMINQLTFLEEGEVLDNFYTQWLDLWTKTKDNPAFYEWHLQLLSDISGYADVIDPRIFQRVAQEGATYLPNNITNQNDLRPYINLFRIANATGENMLISAQRNQLITAARSVLTPEQYEQFIQQFNAPQVLQ